jgi:AAA15 family ATPase/GTPase
MNLALGANIMITQLKLKNFRCFQALELRDISPVTLIAGSNGVGKSTILESIFLFNNRIRSEVFMQLLAFRGITITKLTTEIWENLFANFDINNIIEISTTTDDNKEQSVTIAKDDSFSLSSLPGFQSQANVALIGLPILDAYSLKLTHADSTRKDKYIANFAITVNNIVMTQQQSIIHPTTYTHYINSRTTIHAQLVADWFGRVWKENKVPQCINALKCVDERISDIFVLPQGGSSVLHTNVGHASGVPINTLGDGINKLLNIILVMLSNPGSIILIDEIENGFHYSFFPKLWEIIGNAAQESGCQVVATSHSYECIKGAKCLASNKGKPDLFRFIRLDRIDDVIVPKIFGNEAFEYSINNEWEVR